MYEVVPNIEGPALSHGIAPLPASGWYTTGLGIAVRGTDPAGIASVHWWTDGAVSTNGDVVGEAEGLLQLDAEGVTEVTYWAYNSFGNRSADGRLTVRIDTVAPSLYVGTRPALAAAIPEFVQGSRPTIPLACSDETSGVVDCGLVGVHDRRTAHRLARTAQSSPPTASTPRETAARSVYEYRVVAAPVTEPAGEVAGDPQTLAHTGVDVAGLVLVAGLLVGAGAATIGGRRLLAR